MNAGTELTGNELYPRFTDAEYTRRYPITRDFKAGLQLGAAVIVKPDGGEPLHNYPFKFPVCG